jgi:hypothetical protein
MGMPWRLAFALQADGWWLRQDIIWSKPNPMPESVTDRCTKAHEYVFLLSKSAKYYYDAQAISEPSQGDYGEGKSGKWIDSAQDIGSVYGIEKVTGNQNKGRLNQFSGATRNKRSVWTIASESFSEAHFATYPTKLVEPCIFAGTSEKGCCPKCGAPWSREVDRVPATSKECPKTVSAHIARGGTGTPVGTVGKSGSGRINGSITTIGWYPSCSCNKDDGGLELEPIPCTVLDPFSGSDTTGLVARDNGCKYIGIELNPEYIDISAKRMAQQVLSFA